MPLPLSFLFLFWFLYFLALSCRVTRVHILTGGGEGRLVHRSASVLLRVAVCHPQMSLFFFERGLKSLSLEFNTECAR